MFPATGLVAEWSCSGLQSRVRRFDSDPGLQCFWIRSPRLRVFFCLESIHRQTKSRTWKASGKLKPLGASPVGVYVDYWNLDDVALRPVGHIRKMVRQKPVEFCRLS